VAQRDVLRRSLAMLRPARPQIALAVVLSVLLVLILFGLSWELTLAGLVLAPPAAVGGVWFRKHSRLAYLSVRERTAETIATLVEGVNGIREIQEGHLSDLSVRDNIRIARPAATDDEVARAVERIGVGHVFGALPSGLDGPAGPGGDLLSSGQRQLVALARAALVDADVLILDEATSDLDPGTELIATRALSELLAGRTTIVIAHRLSTILDADRIAIVAEGGISELGTHEELVAARGRYAALYAGWLRGTHHL
jgi:ABC-type multidrug transport system fused ATPase/permease subunit